jgi:HK97 family phage prohead protease
MSDTLLVERLPLEFRTAITLDVRFPDRVIDLVAVPYDEETVVDVHGRTVIESIAPGSFDGIEKRANRIKVNRDHDVLRTVGRVIGLHPADPHGLRAELRIGRSPLGDETLEYAADGILDASIGFAPFPGHETWTDNRTRRRVTKAYLGHIALVPEAAYEGAQVTAVRHAASPPTRVPTPNLDRWRALQLEQLYH